MKIKCRPEDFQVEELSDFAPGAGPFALYRLTKRSIGTPEVVEAVVRRWQIARQRISYGGLKDRHALTAQFVTIERGPRQTLKQSNFELRYLGQAPRPFTPRDIRGNRFEIVLRDLSSETLAHVQRELAAVSRDGVPNYFDDQRFGSLGESAEFVGQAWCRGDFERALWLALADPNEHDRPDDRRQKQILRDGWKDWTACKAALPRSHLRSLVTYLADHPTDFRGAFARTRADLRSLYLSAFQSYLWNRFLSATLQELCPSGALVPVALKIGPVLFPRALDARQRDALNALKLPLPSARAKIEEAAPRARLDRVLADQGLDLRALRIKHPRENFFSKGDRAAIFRPDRLEQRAAADELYAGRQKLLLAFDLPRGSYATMVVKRITEV